jgi:hypothetical protein
MTVTLLMALLTYSVLTKNGAGWVQWIAYIIILLIGFCSKYVV